MSWNRAYWSAYLRRILEAGHHHQPGRLVAGLIAEGLVTTEDVASILGATWLPGS